MPDQLEQVVESNQPEQLGTGFVFTEGPVWHPEGYWLFVDLFREPAIICRLRPGGQVETIREPSGMTNGMTLDLQGRLVMCEMETRQITRIESDGSILVLADKWEGKRLHRPNDIVGHSNGSLYFTNPSGRVDPSEREIDFAGVHRIAPDGTVTAVVTDTMYPNGLAFSPDERTLYVANTRRDNDCQAEKERGEVCTHQFINAYDIAPDGTASNGKPFANMHSAEDGVPDGMKVDIEGRVYCTGPEGVWVFDSQGNHLGIIRLPEIPANCAWGGPDNRTMFFTARHSIFTMRMKTPGTPIPRAS
jgi:gluconolactonase